MPTRPMSAGPRARYAAAVEPSSSSLPFDGEVASSQGALSPSWQHSAPIAPIPEFTTTRGNYKMSKNTIGGPPLRQRSAFTADAAAAALEAASEHYKRHQGLFETYRTHSRPQSASVQAAAFKLYASPEAKGLVRQRPRNPVPQFDPSSHHVNQLQGRRPSSAILGGGFHYPTSRPQTASEQSHVRRSRPTLTTFHAAPDYSGPLLSGPGMVAAPAMQRPMSAGPVLTGASTRVGQALLAHQGEGRHWLAQTLPTDPAAHRVWEQLARRSYFVQPRAEGTAPPTPAQAQARGAVHSSRPMSAKLLQARTTVAAAAGERFATTSVARHQRLMAGYQPKACSGFSPAEKEMAVPPPSDSWWSYSRLGRTAIKKLQQSLKMNVGIQLASELTRARDAKGVQLSPPADFLQAPHDLAQNVAAVMAAPGSPVRAPAGWAPAQGLPEAPEAPEDAHDSVQGTPREEEGGAAEAEGPSADRTREALEVLMSSAYAETLGAGDGDGDGGQAVRQEEEGDGGGEGDAAA